MDILSNPIIVALLALLALPGATSAVAALIRKVSDTAGINPRIPVYIAALALTGVLVATGAAGGLPEATGDPAVVVGAWLTWATVTATLAQRLYELLWQRVPVEPTP